MNLNISKQMMVTGLSQIWANKALSPLACATFAISHYHTPCDNYKCICSDLRDDGPGRMYVRKQKESVQLTMWGEPELILAILARSLVIAKLTTRIILYHV